MKSGVITVSYHEIFCQNDVEKSAPVGEDGEKKKKRKKTKRNYFLTCSLAHLLTCSLAHLPGHTFCEISMAAYWHAAMEPLMRTPRFLVLPIKSPFSEILMRVPVEL